MRAAQEAKPLAAQMTLHPILVRVVGQLAEAPEKRRPIPQPPHLPAPRAHGALLVEGSSADLVHRAENPQSASAPGHPASRSTACQPPARRSSTTAQARGRTV